MIKGVTASVLASVLFGALYYLSPFLAPLDGEQIFGWRVLLTLPFTTALVLWSGEWEQVRRIALRVRLRPLLGCGLLASAALLGAQIWLFMWAPLHGRALPVSLGYFLLPLVMVMAGRAIYREQLQLAHWIAVSLATAGVAFAVAQAGGVTWETWFVAIGYTTYFVLRRRLATDGLAGHWIDMLLISPAALWFALRAPSSLPLILGNSRLQVLLSAVGLLSAAALALYMGASRLLPLGLFGLLTYVEPILLVTVALMLNETIGRTEWPTYALVSAAVLTLLGKGVKRSLINRSIG